MVSNTLGVSAQELLASLQRMRDECRDDREYQELRAQLPSDWPI